MSCAALDEPLISGSFSESSPESQSVGVGSVGAGSVGVGSVEGGSTLGVGGCVVAEIGRNKTVILCYGTQDF